MVKKKQRAVNIGLTWSRGHFCRLPKHEKGNAKSIS